MRRVPTVLGLVVGLVFPGSNGIAQSPYEQPIKPTGFSLQALALPPRAIGSTTLRAKGALAVAVRVTVEDYIPRGLEPTLLIDGTPVPAASGMTAAQDRVTTLTFLVEAPHLLKEGATLALQMGDDPKTRTEVPGVLRRGAIQPPDPAEVRRLGLPSLAEWLSGRPAP